MLIWLIQSSKNHGIYPFTSDQYIDPGGLFIWAGLAIVLWGNIRGSVQDCGIANALALEIPQSCNKPLVSSDWVNCCRFGLQIIFVCLYITPSHYHHCANLPEDIELTKCLNIYFVECVSKIEHILSVIHYTIYGTVSFQFTHFPWELWWLREYTLCLITIIKLEVWTIIHCLRLGHETMVCPVCLSIFLLL